MPSFEFLAALLPADGMEAGEKGSEGGNAKARSIVSVGEGRPRGGQSIEVRGESKFVPEKSSILPGVIIAYDDDDVWTPPARR